MTINQSFMLSEKVRVSGAGGCEGEDLQSRSAEAILSGPGHSELRIADALTEHVGASGGWGSIFCDPIIATAIFDRLLSPRDHEAQAAAELSTVPVSATPKLA